MQRALSIAEIRHLICTQATDHILVQLTQCCKSFHEPAIRVLWNTIPDISPLLRCFPQDAWTIVHIRRVGDSIKLVRSLAPQDWSTFLKYSNLVRNFGTPPSRLSECGLTYRLEHRVLWELSAYRPVFVLFPNLVTFEWSGARFPEEDLPVVLGFLNPNLSRVDIRIAEAHHDPGPLRTSISLIANRFASLKRFHLARKSTQSEDDFLLMPSILSLVQNVLSLEIFWCFHIPLAEDVFFALARLRNLTKFAIRLPEMTAWSRIKIQTDHFPKLRTLALSSRSLDFIEFGNITSFPHVKAARIELGDILTEDDLPRISTSICSQLSLSTLTNLVVVTQGSRQTRKQVERSGSVIRLDHLLPLFKFVNLSSFTFSVASRYALDGVAYLAIAQAWPKINTLEVGLGRLCVHLELPAMHDVLVPFAVHCPKLTQLNVCFDASDARIPAGGGIDNPLPQGTPSTSVLETLKCFDSPIVDAPRVAAVLALLFPKLKNVVCKESADGVGELGESWKEVKQYLPLFATIREDERRREAERQQRS